MQGMKPGKFFRQLGVLLARNFRLIWNQQRILGSLILQAPLMVGVSALVGEPEIGRAHV